jgi:3-mercaptopyruvate sulfurtransferase SseA/sterol desaturase/sphingolipid hydroxylase (fatty acid hydroxylase superfamily)
VSLSAYAYPIALALLSIAVALCEHFFPWRKAQRQLRPSLMSDLAHLVFNGHFLGVLLYGVAVHRILPTVDRFLGAHGLTPVVYRSVAARWPLWLQILVVVVAMDFVQWCVHNLLHRVPLLWEMHKTHHSVVDGEMDFIVSFRFQWLEVVVYKALQYLPLSFFGFSGTAILVHAIFGTLIGHLNHANLDLGYGPWRYVLNSPRMHLWHHNYDADSRTTVNFGIIFSAWDWIFGTAYMPPASQYQTPARIGFRGDDTFPHSFFAQEAWPLQRLLPRRWQRGAVPVVLGGMVLAALWVLHEPPRPPQRQSARPSAGQAAQTPAQQSVVTPLFDEPLAASQPLGGRPLAGSYSRTAQEADAALSRFGSDARAAGYAHPELLVSVPELARALQSPRLVLLDLRPPARFETGHIPSALPVGRADYAEDGPVPGLTRSREHLQALLRARGVRPDSVIVLYTDGGPEAFRFFWSLQAVSALPARLLDGGLLAWKAAGHAVTGGPARRVIPGDVVLPPPVTSVPLRWQEIERLVQEPAALLLDSRTRAEYRGDKQHPEAARSGHIPGARHLDWQSVLRGPDDPRLRPVEELRALFQPFGLAQRSHIVTACQSGTRSSVLYFALLQLGVPRDKLLNYNGSWAEYSRLGLPLVTGDEP